MLKRVSVFIVLLSIITFAGFHVTHVKAAGEVIEMEPGASIRTVGTQGLKFSATFNAEALASMDAVNGRGFFIMYGTATVADLIAAEPDHTGLVNGKTIKQQTDYDLTSNTISVVLTGIPFANYNQEITVVGYMKIGGTYTYTPTVVTRSVDTIFNGAIPDLATGYTAEYPGTKDTATFTSMLTNHGFSGYTMLHNGKMFFFGYNSYIPLRAMEMGETVLPWDAVQTHTTGPVRLDSVGLNIDGPIEAGTNGMGALYYNGNMTNLVVYSKDLYGYQSTSAWGNSQYGVIRVDDTGEVVERIIREDLATGINITLEPGDYLLTSFEADRFAFGGAASCYYQGADFAVGQTVVITDSGLAYGE